MTTPDPKKRNVKRPAKPKPESPKKPTSRPPSRAKPKPLTERHLLELWEGDDFDTTDYKLLTDDDE